MHLFSTCSKNRTPLPHFVRNPQTEKKSEKNIHKEWKKTESFEISTRLEISIPGTI